MSRLPWLSAIALIASLAGATCGPFGVPSARGPYPGPSPTPISSPTAAATHVPCTDPTASLRPQGPLPRAGDLPNGSYAQQIYNRGRLIAGIAQDTLMFGYLNPLNNQLQGFDIDLARQLSQAIFGDDLHVEYRVITPAQAVSVLQDGTVDIVVRTLPMTCARWQQIDFSTEYFEAGQSVMVPRSSSAKGISDLGKKRVCAALGTDALANIAAAPSHPIPVGVVDPTDCLVQLELGTVDAISADDVILDGFLAQDPNVTVVGPRIATLPYGIGISQAHPDFVRYVNAMLEQVRANGTWTRLYKTWMSQLGPASAPAANYRD